jgi:hypothetical protein
MMKDHRYLMKNKLKLPAARFAGSSYCICELLKTSGGESSICIEETFDIRSLAPRQAAGNALAVRFITTLIIAGGITIAHAQPSGLGWSGSDLIPLNEFADSSNWNCNYQSSAGDTCHVTADSTSLNLHWKFSNGKRHKYAQCFQVLSPALSLSDADIIAIDVKGTHCQDNRNIKIKFEDGTHQASYQWENLAKITRWCERISVLKNQFGDADKLNWARISVISLEVYSNASDQDTGQDSGMVSFRNLRYDFISDWRRATSLETLEDDTIHQTIKQNAIDAILARQSSTGLFYTWLEDRSSYLYGHGLVLKLLSLEGVWENKECDNQYAEAAEKLALFLCAHQNTLGFWPRAWHTDSGAIRQNLEQDSTIWFGDFPWAIIGLQSYYKQSGDERVKQSIDKAKSFLYGLIEENGRLNTLNPRTNEKFEVTSSEAYAATMIALYELGDDTTAEKMMRFIDENAWDDNLKYWKEGTNSSRVVLLANTWLSLVAGKTSRIPKACDALSFAGKVLFTRGPGEPDGLDGVGPVATWFEGTLSYICAGGPGSRQLFEEIIQYINIDGTVPHYNDDLGGMAGVWAVNWSSLDGTAWLYLAASRQSLIDKVSNQFRQKTLNYKLSQNYPNPFNSSTKISYSIRKSGPVSLTIFDTRGREVRTWARSDQEAGTHSIDFNSGPLSSGLYFYKLVVGKSIVETRKMLLLR